MKCNVCLKDIDPGKEKYTDYHDKCVVGLLGSLKVNPVLDFTRKDFVTDKAQKRTRGMSISGVQPKLSVKIENNKIEVTDQGGEYILKPSPEEYEELAINEFVTMRLALEYGIDSTAFGLLKFSDGEPVYLIKRFDRIEGRKLHQEDMTQAMSVRKDEEGKYKYQTETYESVGTFLKERVNLIVATNFFKRVFFNFMVGNDDYHLKNISVIETKSGNYKLTPNYDSVNSSIYHDEGFGETALDMFPNDYATEKFEKYGFLTKEDFDVLGQRIGINKAVRERTFNDYFKVYERLLEIVQGSPLSSRFKSKYLKTMQENFKKFNH